MALASTFIVPIDGWLVLPFSFFFHRGSGASRLMVVLADFSMAGIAFQFVSVFVFKASL